MKNNYLHFGKADNSGYWTEASFDGFPDLLILIKVELLTKGVDNVVAVIRSGMLQCYSGVLQCYSGVLQCYSGVLQCYRGVLQCYSGV